MRISAFPFYAGIKGPLSGGETVRKCVRVAASLEPFGVLKISVLNVYFQEIILKKGMRRLVGNLWMLESWE